MAICVAIASILLVAFKELAIHNCDKRAGRLTCGAAALSLCSKRAKPPATRLAELIMSNSSPIAPHVFHVAFHKTGTTYAQHQLLPLLNNGAVYVPATELDIDHQAAGWTMKYTGTNGEVLRAENIVISNEGIAGELMRYDMKRLSDLKRVNPDARIMFSIRDQRSLIRSTYWQAVKGGYPKNYNTFQKEIFEYGQFDYAALHKAVVSEFGSDNVLFVLFEETTSDPQAAMDRIAKFAGSRSIPKVKKTSPEKTSPTELVVETQRILNNLGIIRKPRQEFHPVSGTIITGAAILAKRCDRIWEKISGKRPLTIQTEEDRKAIEKHFSASNREFFAKLYDTPYANRYPGMSKQTSGKNNTSVSTIAQAG